MKNDFLTFNVSMWHLLCTLLNNRVSPLHFRARSLSDFLESAH